jgi:hemoglobin/transferrin/lactoferrin receptor protein
MRLPEGRRYAGLFLPAAGIVLACAAAAAPIDITSADGRYRLVAADGAGELSVLSASDGKEIRRIPVVDRDRKAGTLAWIIDLPRRQSFLAGLADRPEAWELPYGSRAEPVYEGLVHDYRMGEGIADAGPLPVRRIPLEAPMPLPQPDDRQVHVSWRDPARPAQRIVLNLDVRRVVSRTVEPAPDPAPPPNSPTLAPAKPGFVPRIERLQVIAAASRVEEAVDSVPATVSVIERQDAFREVAANLRDLLRYEPGVSIENAPTRFGLGNLNIRGLDGNRVQMTLDGIRLPESYRVGSFSNASRNALGIGLLRQVEIVRGPASAIHGSDALAGVVAFTTANPGPALAGGKRAGGEAFAGYTQADGGLARGGLLALQAGPTQVLLGAERLDGNETSNRGDVGGTGNLRTLPNPQDARSESQLVKWVVPADGGWRFVLTADRYAHDVRTDVLTLNPQSSRTTRLDADDRARRERYSIDAIAHDVAMLSRLTLTVYTQTSLTQQDTAELRTNTTAVCLSAAGTVSCLREPRFRYETRERGIVALGERDATWGPVAHHLVAGAEASRSRLTEERSGRQTNLDTGAVTNVVGGEALPTRDFPITDTDRFGAFAQDSVALRDSPLTWIPGIRFDAYRLRPQTDEIFAAGNPGRPVVDLTDQALSPKLGLLLRASSVISFTGQLATGYRAPSATDLNIGLTSLPAGYAVVPNPGLRPETSRGAEGGVRYRAGTLQAMATAFYTRYRDLIVSRAPLACPSDPGCVPGATGTFQSQNVSSARIYGLEAKAEWRFAPAWSARAALSIPRGDDLGKSVPLNSVDPARLVAGLGYESPRWGAALHVTHTRSQTRVDRSAGINFVPPGWTTADLTAWWTPLPSLEIAAGLFNIADRKYWLWSDVRSLTNISAGFDRYTQPGRTYGVNARWKF